MGHHNMSLAHFNIVCSMAILYVLKTVYVARNCSHFLFIYLFIYFLFVCLLKYITYAVHVQNIVKYKTINLIYAIKICSCDCAG